MRTFDTLQLNHWDYNLVARRKQEFDMDPRRWLTSGFFESMRLFLGFAHSTLKKLSLITNFECLPTDKIQIWVARNGVKKIFGRILQSNINGAPELYRLNDELAALRFYALQKVPHHMSLDGIQRSAQSSRLHRLESKGHQPVWTDVD